MLIPIVIPSYEPDEKLLTLLEELRQLNSPVILVNDGSGHKYDDVFAKARTIIGDSGAYIAHEVNRGKGRALKSAFEFVINNYPDALGVVTADSDGQHAVSCIRNMQEALCETPDKMILGVRDFDTENIPWKSRFGNKVSLKVMKYLGGIELKDTQTGLRAIPYGILSELINVKGERFEYETQVLVDSYGRYEIRQIPIETIYDSKDNHSTHFNPIKDSARIYSIFGMRLLRYAFSSLSSSVIDLVIFTLLCGLLRESMPVAYIGVATVIARIISATYNYLINYALVFHSTESKLLAAVKYCILAIIQMLVSAFAVSGLILSLGLHDETLVKIIVDVVLFFISYYIQQSLVFKRN